MGTLLRIIRKLSVAFAVLFSLLLVAVTGLLDYVNGHEFLTGVFYLIPISIAVVRFGIAAGIVFSILSGGAILAADMADSHVISTWFSPYWNSSVHLGYFFLHATVLGFLIKHVDAEEKQATCDFLTGASNARHFEEFAEREIMRAKRSGQPLTVAYIDFDNFKEVNDKFGHRAGDELLKMSVSLMQKEVRATDLVARMGGDEFVLILPETDYENSSAIVERMKNNLQDAFAEKNWPVTLSVGAVTFSSPPQSVDRMIADADKLMYKVKATGKNKVLHEKQETAKSG